MLYRLLPLVVAALACVRAGHAGDAYDIMIVFKDAKQKTDLHERMFKLFDNGTLKDVTDQSAAEVKNGDELTKPIAGFRAAYDTITENEWKQLCSGIAKKYGLDIVWVHETASVAPTPEKPARDKKK